MDNNKAKKGKIIGLSETTAASVVVTEPTFDYRPLGNSILLKVPEETTSGIILTETMQKEFLSDEDALVTAVGPECKYVKEGDYIKLYSHAAKAMMSVTINGKPHLQFSETLVAGILTKK